MATDSNTLLNEAKCLGCASNASMADMLKVGLWSRIAGDGNLNAILTEIGETLLTETGNQLLVE